MKKLLHSRSFYVVIALVLIGLAIAFMVKTLGNQGPQWITAEVTRGPIANIVSVSGVVEAENTAELAFPTTGIVAEVLVKEGSVIRTGDTLVMLEQTALQAERRDAAAALLIAQADRDELISGPRSEARDVTNSNVAIAEENLMRTIAEEAEKVANARRTLLSSNLEAVPARKDSSDTAPTVSGTYTCDIEGSYIVTMFPSSAQSGYSYRLSGLGTGTYNAFDDFPGAFGDCGLSLQIAENVTYARQDWTIVIPNPEGATYTTNLNSYQLALQQEKNRVEAAEQALDLALREQTLENASPREEALQRANATVMQAEARLAVIDAQISDRTLIAPFSGTVTSVEILKGETAGTQPVITMVANDIFELTARIPEIDITKILVGQEAEVVFDARPSEILRNQVAFISPLATEIDGVAYFEAKLAFTDPPVWLRSGLNADIDIIIDEKEDALRIPKRFLIDDEGAYSVLRPNQLETASMTVERGFVGNDGFVEIIGLNEGDTVVAP